jgi:hypothetical protein
LFRSRGIHSKADLGEAVAQRLRLAGQLAQRGVLDLPGALHLLDDELGVHPHRDPLRAELAGRGQPGDQAAVLGDVVGGDADRLGPLGQHLAGGRVENHRAVTGGSGIAPRPAVRFDDHPLRH